MTSIFCSDSTPVRRADPLSSVPLDAYADGWAAGIRAMACHPDRVETYLRGIRDAIRETRDRRAASPYEAPTRCSVDSDAPRVEVSR